MDQLLEVLVAALKKREGETPLQIRPISLTSHIYRIWAKLRWSQLQPWRLQWVPNELHGGIANREAIDSFFAVAFDIEASSFNQHPVYGILYDYQKWFGKICWRIQQNILNDLGMSKTF